MKKNISLAVEAFDLLINSLASPPSDVKLVIAGGYDERVLENRLCEEQLQALVRQKGLQSKVVFIKDVNDEDKKILLSHSLAVIYTPQFEHFGIVPIEALASKKASNCNE